MSPMTKIGNAGLSEARLICTICKKYVEEEQKQRGKALCRHCEITYYGDRPFIPIVKPMEMVEFIERRRDFEERIFLEIMRRIFRKLSE